jgi:hypothetical protein
VKSEKCESEKCEMEDGRWKTKDGKWKMKEDAVHELLSGLFFYLSRLTPSVSCLNK